MDIILNMLKNASIAVASTFICASILGAATQDYNFLILGGVMGATTSVLFKIDKIIKNMESINNNIKKD